MVDTGSYDGFDPATDGDTIKEGIATVAQTISNSFKVSPGGTHIGVVTYNSLGSTVLGLLSGTSESEVSGVINSVQYGSNNEHSLSSGLSFAFDEIHSNSRRLASPDNLQVVVVFAMQPPTDLDAAIAEAERLKSNNIITVLVSINPSVTSTELEPIVTDSDNIFVQDFNSLSDLWRGGFNLKPVFCPVSKPVTTTTVTTPAGSATTHPTRGQTRPQPTTVPFTTTPIVTPAAHGNYTNLLYNVNIT